MSPEPVTFAELNKVYQERGGSDGSTITVELIHKCSGMDGLKMVKELLHNHYTGAVTLHVRTGRVMSVEWREKQKQ